GAQRTARRRRIARYVAFTLRTRPLVACCRSPYLRARRRSDELHAAECERVVSIAFLLALPSPTLFYLAMWAVIPTGMTWWPFEYLPRNAWPIRSVNQRRNASCHPATHSRGDRLSSQSQ